MAGIGRAMRIAKLEKKRFAQALEEYVDAYNSWPHSVTGIPPRDLLYGRVVRSEIPASDKLFNKYLLMDTMARERDEQFKSVKKQKTDRKRGAKESKLSIGDWVHIKLDSPPNKLSPTFSADAFQIKGKDGGRLTIMVNGKERIRKTTDVKLKRQGEHLGSGDPFSENETLQEEKQREVKSQPINDSDPHRVAAEVPALRRSTRVRVPPPDRQVDEIVQNITNQETTGERHRKKKIKKTNAGDHCRSCGGSNKNEIHAGLTGLTSCNAPTADKKCFKCGASGHFAYRCNI